MNRALLFAGSIRNLNRFRLRSFLMGIGVALGVATLIAGSSIGRGAEKLLTDQINQMFGPGTILLLSAELKDADLQAIDDQMEQVIAWSPRLSMGEKEVSFLGESRQAAISGHSENAEYVWNRSVVDGRFFDKSDISRAARVALIGTDLADELFAEGEAMGKEIMISSVPFEVVGVLEPIGIDPHGENLDMDVYVPISTAQRRLVKTDSVGSAKLVVSNADLVDQDADQVAAILRDRHQIAEGQKETFRIFTSKFAGKAAIKAKRVMTVYVVLAAVLVLLVAAVVIASIMLIVVRERIAEIGLRKAMGATPGSIVLQFLLESTSLTLLFGVLGMGLGYAVAAVIASRYEIPMELTVSSVAVAILASAAVGIAAGILPARRAASLDPVEALR
jgi:putative ABC transport system permease protein